ncbi:hypothetical protein K438DRAFT_1946229, partial [Mycena galopus ATCC 62051]
MRRVVANESVILRAHTDTSLIVICVSVLLQTKNYFPRGLPPHSESRRDALVEHIPRSPYNTIYRCPPYSVIQRLKTGIYHYHYHSVSPSAPPREDERSVSSWAREAGACANVDTNESGHSPLSLHASHDRRQLAARCGEGQSKRGARQGLSGWVLPHAREWRPNSKPDSHSFNRASARIACEFLFRYSYSFVRSFGGAGRVVDSRPARNGCIAINAPVRPAATRRCGDKIMSEGLAWVEPAAHADADGAADAHGGGYCGAGMRTRAEDRWPSWWCEREGRSWDEIRRVQTKTPDPRKTRERTLLPLLRTRVGESKKEEEWDGRRKPSAVLGLGCAEMLWGQGGECTLAGFPKKAIGIWRVFRRLLSKSHSISPSEFPYPAAAPLVDPGLVPRGRVRRIIDMRPSANGSSIVFGGAWAAGGSAGTRARRSCLVFDCGAFRGSGRLHRIIGLEAPADCSVSRGMHLRVKSSFSVFTA